MPTLKEMAEETAAIMGHRPGTGEFNRYVTRYLIGATDALKMAADAMMQRNHESCAAAIRTLIPES